MRRAPLSRPMFRSRTAPGASRQPTGVLASSPELMQAAMRNLPNPAPGAGVQNPFQPAVFNQGAGESLLQNMSAPALNIAAGDRPLDVSAAPEPTTFTTPDPKPKPDTQPLTLPDDVDDRTAKAAQPMLDSANKLRAATDNILENVPGRDDVVVAGKSVNELYKDAFDAMDEDTPTLSDYNLADFEDMAMESLGYTKGRGPKQIANEDKKTSFWLSLIKAGLATAAGESPYALTNIARGLSFGVESFGRDMKDISAAEREENRAIASAKLALLQDQRSVDVANRAAKIQAAQFKAQLGDSIRQEDRADAFKQIDIATGYLQIENSLYQFVASQDANWASIDFNKEKFAATLKATLAAQTPDIIRELSVAGYVVPKEEGGTVDFSDSDSYKLTDKGIAIFNNWILKRGEVKLTDLVRTADAAGETMIVGSMNFADVENGSERAETVSTLLGKLASDPDAAAAQQIPAFRITPGVSTTGRPMIEALWASGNYNNLEFYGIVDDEGEIKQGRLDLDMLKRKNDADALDLILEIKVKKPPVDSDDELATEVVSDQTIDPATGRPKL